MIDPTEPDDIEHPPRDREAALAAVDPARRPIYHLVRAILDDLEAAAPWNLLYAPPEDSAALGGLLKSLLAVLRTLPGRLDAARLEVEAAGSQTVGGSTEVDALVDDLEFFFRGILQGTEGDVERLTACLQAFGRGGVTDADDHSYAAEIAADLKGKLASSIMGAAAALVAGERWSGVELEPILFAEKAEEFGRNDRLVSTLTEVVDGIANLVEEFPLGELIETWRRGERVDRYALTPLYSLLGDLGKLMRETSRRALYSGDYHQIQRRESLVSARVHRMATLHHSSWGLGMSGEADGGILGQRFTGKTQPTASVLGDAVPDGDRLFSELEQLATELVLVLDIDFAKRTLGDGRIDRVLSVVTIEKEALPTRPGRRVRIDVPSEARERLPAEDQPLVPLLYDEDLSTFLELLLGAVLKRASLTVQHRGEATARDPSSTAIAAPESLEDLDSIAGLDTGPSVEELLGRQQALEAARQQIVELVVRSAERKQFELVLRLLRQGRTLPPALAKSMQPYLWSLMNHLVPTLVALDWADGRFPEVADELLDASRDLCRPQPTNDELHGEFPPRMEGVLRLVDSVRIAVDRALDRLGA